MAANFAKLPELLRGRTAEYDQAREDTEAIEANGKP